MAGGSNQSLRRVKATFSTKCALIPRDTDFRMFTLRRLHNKYDGPANRFITVAKLRLEKRGYMLRRRTRKLPEELTKVRFGKKRWQLKRSVNVYDAT